MHPSRSYRLTPSAIPRRPGLWLDTPIEGVRLTPSEAIRLAARLTRWAWKQILRKR